jgi:hypothetical protein
MSGKEGAEGRRQKAEGRRQKKTGLIYRAKTKI